MSDFIFYRKNLGSWPDDLPSAYSEEEVRPLIAASCGNVERAIKKLKRGYPVRTRFATYTAKTVEKTRRGPVGLVLSSYGIVKDVEARHQTAGAKSPQAEGGAAIPGHAPERATPR